MQSHTAVPAQAPARAPDRTDRYLDRLEVHLESLPSNAARCAFLGNELIKWTSRYERFLAEDEAGTIAPAPGDDPPHAADYVCTISALAARRAMLEGVE